MSVAVELQTLIFETLVADADVGVLIGDRIYDGPPVDREFPCVTFGPDDSTFDELREISTRTETVQLDVWSRDGARLRPCKQICDAIKAALHHADLSLITHALVTIEIEGMRAFMDRDGRTAHGVVTVQAQIEER
ncbi:DUF3168 domain-containing protein [Phaeobacter sp. NW0010-22]|uniref:DUF3168 domain-containing protein n=1 Tax=Phaeobacter sp. NW0010-22 TaxID=3135907 RepID=UPI00310BFD65